VIGKFLSTFVILIIIWFSLSGITYQETIIGIFLAVAISAVISTKVIPNRISKMSLRGLFLLLLFIPKFLLYEILNHLKLLKIIYSPKLKIDPAIIEVPLNLKQKLQITSVATAVTMLPGTFSLDYDDKLHIHTIDKNEKVADFTHRLEKELGRAFS